MKPDESVRLEEWIEARLLEYQSLSASGFAETPESFAARTTAGEAARAVLLERLRLLRRLEGGFAALRDEPIGPASELADFEVLELLGQGGMGRVFRARQKSLAREVALKVPRFGSAFDPGARLRFLREAQAVAQLRHPNIVPLYQLGEHQGAPFLVFELAEARALSAVLGDLAAGRMARESRSLGRSGESYERAAVQVVIAVLEALAAAHDAGIVHRDVKPGNVLLERDGRVRVVDFGLARLRDQVSLTGSQEVLGTASYMAPEVVHGAQAAGPWSDVYAAGVILYELLALKRPFEGGTPAQTLARIEAAELAPLHVSLRISKPLSAIVETAMAREIGRRYPSAAAFADDLRAYLDGREVRARPSTRLARLGRRMQKYPAVTVVSVVLAVVLALFGGVWRSRSEVRAQVRLANAKAITCRALPWWYADGVPGGGPPTQSAGRDHAIELLESALREDPDLVEARVELAQYSALRGKKDRALELIEGLEARGLRLRSLAWTRAHLLDATSRTLRPAPDEGLDLATVHELDRLAWARHLLQIAENEKAMEVLRPIEADEVLGPAAQYVQFEACNTRAHRDLTRATGYLRAALAVTPDQPVLLANLASVYDERRVSLTAQPVLKKHEQQEKANLDADIEALFPLLEAAERRAPWVRALWLNHSVLLAHGGRIEEAAAIVRKGLEHHPFEASLTNELAQTCFDRWSALLERDGTIPPEELEELRLRLERVVEEDPSRPENLCNLAYVHYLRDDAEATLVWGDLAQLEYLPYLDKLPPSPETEKRRSQLAAMMSWARGAADAAGR